MQAIATLLDKNADQRTQEVWQTLEKTCGLSGIKVPKDPHLSWCVADKFDEAGVRSEFNNLTRELAGFDIQTNGMGLFTGEKPILYIPVVKTRQLLDLHEKIWKTLTPYGENRSEVYGPENWIPHITITSDESSLINLGCIVNALLHLALGMTIKINHLALIYSDEQAAGINFVKHFGKDEA